MGPAPLIAVRTRYCGSRLVGRTSQTLCSPGVAFPADLVPELPLDAAHGDGGNGHRRRAPGPGRRLRRRMDVPVIEEVPLADVPRSRLASRRFRPGPAAPSNHSRPPRKDANAPSCRLTTLSRYSTAAAGPASPRDATSATIVSLIRFLMGRLLAESVAPDATFRHAAGRPGGSYPPTCTTGRRSGSGSTRRRISRVTGAVSPWPNATYLRTNRKGLPSVHPK